MQWSQLVLSCLMASKEKYPDRPAVVDRGGERVTTFAQFVDAVNAFGAAFTSKGLVAGDRVVLLLGRTMEFHACRMACFARGIVFTAISMRMPADRRSAMIDICKPELVADQEFAQWALDTFPDSPNCLDESIPDAAPGFMVFTSGTTGTPKCILHNRSAFEALCYSQVRINIPSILKQQFDDPSVAAYSLDAYNQKQHLRFLSITDPSMMISMADASVALGSDCLIIPPIELLADREGMLKFLETWDVNSGIMVPDLLASLSSYTGFEQVVVGGDANKHDYSYLEDVDIANAYGASECFIIGYGDAKKGNAMTALVVGAELYVDDNDEICFSGPGIMMGYFDESGEFVTAGDVLHTGDFGRQAVDENGNTTVEIIGRLDNTVKIRGMRVAYEEVEAAMMSVAGVAEAAVVLDPETKDSLIGFYVSEDGSLLDHSLFLQVATAKLPDHMVPKAFVHVDAFEHTVSGKIVRDAVRDLAQSYREGESSANDFVAPRDDVEKRVAAAFCRVLGVGHVSAVEGFTYLGGDSLSALLLQEELSREFDISISANQLLDLQTVAAVAEVVKSPDAYTLPQVKELLFNYGQPCPLTDAQWNVYFSHLDSTDTSFNLPFSVDFDKSLSDDEIIESLSRVMARHPGLAARLVHVDGDPLIQYDAPFSVSRGTLEDADALLRPFNLEENMVRMLLVELEDCKRLYTCFHHMVTDGTSVSLLIRELCEEFARNRGTKGDKLAVEAERMERLSLEENAVDKGVLRQLTFEKLIRSTQAFEAAGLFFEEMLQDSDTIEGLLPSAVTGRHCRMEFEPFADIDVIKTFASQHGLTVGQLLTLGFAYTLSVFTADSRALFSIIEDGRGMAGAEQGIGMFTRTIPVVVDCANQPVQTFLTQQAAIIRKALTFDFYPLHLISAFGRIETRVQFQYAHEMREFASNHELLRAVDTLRDFVQPNNDLSFEVIHKDGKLACEIEHSEIYSDDLCRSMVSVFEQVIKGFTEAETLSDIPVLPAHQAAWLDANNQTDTHIDDANLVELFNRSVARFGDRPFVAFEGGSYTYSQGAFLISNIADAIGRARKERAGRDGTCETPSGNVIILTDRTQSFVLASWGALAAGCAYVPVEAVHPDERVTYVAETVNADIVLADDFTEARAHQLFDGEGIPVINVAHIEACYDGVSTAHGIEAPPWHDEDVAFIVFTSGSTGQPKGIETPMRSFANMIHNYAKNTQMNWEDVYSLYTPVSFDMHSLALFTSVAAGACITVVPEDLRLDLTGLDAYFKRMGTTHVCMTTHIGKLFVSSGLGKSIKHLLVIGEVLGEFTAPEQPLMWESYGPAETYALITMISVNERSHHSSVGSLFDNIRTYLTDSCGRRVPVGAVGEICIAGRQVALGYCGRSDLTDKAFVENPFAHGESGFATMYRTGDMGRYLPDGTIGILGRRDGQVKIRGNRVELGEVEAAIKRHPAVKDAVVNAQDRSGEKELVAYVVLCEGAPEAAANQAELTSLIAEEVKATKPAYMVPAYVVRMDEFPLNTSGKINRRALPAIDTSIAQANYVAPTCEMERILCDVLADVLHVNRFGIDDDFTSMGGDSVSAMRAAYELEKAGVKCSALQILSLHTPRALTEVSRFIEDVEERTDVVVGADVCMRARRDDNGFFIAPLSTTQMNFYDNEMMRDMGSSYVFTSDCLCPEGTTVKQAHAAVEKLMAIHPVLTGKINVVDDVPCIVSGGDCEILVMRDDSADSLAFADEMRKAAMQPFELDKCISRFVIGSSDGHVGIIGACHHIISDAASMRLVSDHLTQLLAGRALPTDWDFIEQSNNLMEAAASQRFADAKSYFQSHVTVELVERHALGAHRSLGGQAGTLVVAVPGVRDQVDVFCSKHDLTVGAFLHAVFAYTLRRFAGFDECMYKTGLHGRFTPASTNALGCYAEFTIAINDSCDTLQDAMNGALERMLEVVDHSIYPYKLLKDEFPQITFVPFFEYVPLQTVYQKRNATLVEHSGWKGSIEHTECCDSDQFADFTGAVYDYKDGFAFFIDHTSKYNAEELERLAISFFDAMAEALFFEAGEGK